MNRHELTYLPENLLWAWRKVRRSYRTTDALFHWGDVAQFELCLEDELATIGAQFREGRYKMSPLTLVPQPKKPGVDGKPRLRQYFQVAVRDQVAWTALTNVIGPTLDGLMPAWSYGNRLYRAAWYDEPLSEEAHSKLNLGPYRHAAGYLYRHFKHSWPLYRRHVSLTARRMANAKISEDELDLGERSALSQIEGLRYLQPNYWPSRGTRLFHASLDLKKFYPSIHLDALRRGFALLPGFNDDPKLISLVDSLLKFEVQKDGLSLAMQAAVDPPVVGKSFGGIPTGLFVGGFLANVAMLPIDNAVDEIQRSRRNIAHFRFVDDHEILSYDGDELVAWIKEYDSILKNAELGAEIERDKYSHPDLKYLIHSDNPDQPDTDTLKQKLSDFKLASSIDGLKPTSLMTRTLAQVSMIGATNFDLLTDAGRIQRIEQLEWLLLANIPETEIRSDTRAAFAASRIAKLTPGLFKVDDEHINKSRRLGELRNSLKLLKAPDPADLTEIELLQAELPTLSAKNEEAWQRTLRRFFSLLMEAFEAHPDKVRLFIKIIDYCRTTGFNGFPQVERWMMDHSDGDAYFLRCYLGSMGIHVAARHLITACRDLNNVELTHRERRAASDFISHFIAVSWKCHVPISGAGASLECFQRDSLEALVAATQLGALEIDKDFPDLSQRLRQFGENIPLKTIENSLPSLRDATGRPLGVWVHWFLSVSASHPYNAPIYWQQLTALLNPDELSDWNCLRRYPDKIPASAWERMNGAGKTWLAKDDAGWLYDAVLHDKAVALILNRPKSLVSLVKARLSSPAKRISLNEWVESVSELDASDPRCSEWTALEIIRQLVASLTPIEGGPDLDVLDNLHPANILVPASWIALSDEFRTAGRLTWEGWRRLVNVGTVTFAAKPLSDYRYTEAVEEATGSWPRRLRGVGQLLWGLLRLTFKLPSAWNIRGQERSLVDIVSGGLERLPISSWTLVLLRSCLMSRNRETAIMEQFPELFGKTLGVANDTEFDWPVTSPEQLVDAIEKAQKMLLETQMTLLEHEPRQLIPVHLKQIGSLSGMEPDTDELDL